MRYHLDPDERIVIRNEASRRTAFKQSRKMHWNCASDVTPTRRRDLVGTCGEFVFYALHRDMIEGSWPDRADVRDGGVDFTLKGAITVQVRTRDLYHGGLCDRTDYPEASADLFVVYGLSLKEFRVDGIGWCTGDEYRKRRKRQRLFGMNVQLWVVEREDLNPYHALIEYLKAIA